jgi:hypothetical protein
MKTVSRFETADGKLFRDEKKAAVHEAEVKEVNRLKWSILPKKLDTCEFANGGGYIQLTPAQVAEFMDGFENVIKTFYPSLLEVYKRCPTGIIGRYLSDNEYPCYTLWLLACQISHNRLYGQAYYANNPSECKNREYRPSEGI